MRLRQKSSVVTDPMMVKLGNTAKITDILDKGGTRYAIFDGVISEPTDRIIEAGLKAWNNEKCDFLIAVGGGSPIDAMKAIGAVATSGCSVNDFLGKVITVPTPPNGSNTDNKRYRLGGYAVYNHNKHGKGHKNALKGCGAYARPCNRRSGVYHDRSAVRYGRYRT